MHASELLNNKIRLRLWRRKGEHHIRLILAEVVQTENTLRMKMDVRIFLRESLHAGSKKKRINSIGNADADSRFSIRRALLYAGCECVKRFIQVRQGLSKLLSARRQLYTPFGRDQKLNAHLMLKTPDPPSYRRVAEFEL